VTTVSKPSNGSLLNHQRRFDFGPLSVAPLWSVNGVMGILKRDADDVIAFILEGKLPWAWNIATQERRAEWRVWSKSVHEFVGDDVRSLTSSSLPSRPSVKNPESHSEVITQLLGHSRAILRGSEIRSVWTCDRQTIQRHIQLGNLILEDPAVPRHANVTPRITRASFEKFMHARCAKLCHAVSPNKNQVMEMTGGTSV
jgi:hypothetical protein